MSTAVYARISEDRQNGAGVERQLEDCLALAERHGWELYQTPYVDNDISASAYARKVRPAYRRLLAGVRSGEHERILTWNIDRLYRKPVELEELIELADQGRVEVISVTGGDVDLTNSDGRLVARMLVSVAAKSSEDTSRRLRRQKQQARQRGDPSGGPRPFGWADHMTPDPEESRLLLEAMDRMLAGASLSDIARDWTAQRVCGRKWHTGGVARALTKARHAGLVVHQGQVVGEGRWPALVPRARWEQVCEMVRSRARHRFTPRRSMLTGLIHCGNCGAVMRRSSNVGGHRVWRCERGPRVDGCGRVSMVADPLEAVVVRAVWQWLDTADLAALLPGGDERPDYALLTEQLADLDRREDVAGASFATGRISLRTLEQVQREVEAQRQALRQRLARTANRDALAHFAGRPGALQAAWPLLGGDQRRAIIAESLGRVTILPATRRGRVFDPRRIVLAG